MAKEIHEYSPRHRSQLEIIAHYRNRLDALSPENKSSIHAISLLDGESPVRGFRISLSKLEAPKKGIITDWDDTLENYSSRKPAYFQALYESIGSTQLSSADFAAICKSINRATRVLNWQNIHPEAYSPFLEMVTETELIQDISNNSTDPAFLALLQVPSEKLAREYIASKVLPLLSANAHSLLKGDKTYFVEKSHQSLAHTLEEKHALVSQSVWNIYQQSMTLPNIDPSAYDHFDLTDDIFWTVSTFGAPEFQLQKIIASLELLKKQGKRVPNEIMLITHGRKQQALLHHMDEYPNTDWTYVDDSERQLQSLHEARPNTNTICAKRPGTKRELEPSAFPTTDMSVKLSTLI